MADHREYITYDSVIIQTCAELAVFCGFFLKSAGERHAQLADHSPRDDAAESRVEPRQVAARVPATVGRSGRVAHVRAARAQVVAVAHAALEVADVVRAAAGRGGPAALVSREAVSLLGGVGEAAEARQAGRGGLSRCRAADLSEEPIRRTLCWSRARARARRTGARSAREGGSGAPSACVVDGRVDGRYQALVWGGLMRRAPATTGVDGAVSRLQRLGLEAREVQRAEGAVGRARLSLVEEKARDLVRLRAQVCSFAVGGGGGGGAWG